jgi:hypothetical protein
MTPHHHRWVKRKGWGCTVGPAHRGLLTPATVGCECGQGRCSDHDPRRPPTPAEREERRVLLRHVGERWGRGIRTPWVHLDISHCAEDLDAILESAAYSWTRGPHG